jgi:diamine N-acetyltransferase
MPERRADVTLWDVSGDIRRRCIALDVHDPQRAFVAPVATYLAMCDDEGVWTPVAVCRDDDVVGFAMWGHDRDEDSHWVGGVLVDRAHQRQGIARRALELLIERLASDSACREIALSYDAENAAARALYASLGFVETGEETDDSEVVARRPARLPAD